MLLESMPLLQWWWSLLLLLPVLGTVNTTWTDPSSTGTPKMDLATDDTLPETTWDALMSDLNALGGSTGRRASMRREWVKGADVASAATLTLGTDGNTFNITGNTGPITAINAGAAGTIVVLIFDSTPTINHHATNLILRDGANFTAAAGDVMVLVSTGSSTVREISRQLAAEVATQAEMEAAASLTKMVPPGRLFYFPGSLKGLGQLGTGGGINWSYGIASIADTGTGLVTVTWSNTFSSTNNMVPQVSTQNTAEYVPSVSALTSTTVTGFRSANVAGTPTDPTAWFVSIGGDI